MKVILKKIHEAKHLIVVEKILKLVTERLAKKQRWQKSALDVSSLDVISSGVVSSNHQLHQANHDLEM